MSRSTRVQHRRRLDTVSSPDSRARVLDAALRLIRKRGDAAVTMAQIAKAARLSRQAVYLHFADRADLMVALARHVNESLGLPAEIQRLMNSPTGIEMIEAFVSMQARGTQRCGRSRGRSMQSVERMRRRRAPGKAVSSPDWQDVAPSSRA